jgi:hypothetical protein
MVKKLWLFLASRHLRSPEMHAFECAMPRWKNEIGLVVVSILCFQYGTPLHLRRSNNDTLCFGDHKDSISKMRATENTQMNSIIVTYMPFPPYRRPLSAPRHLHDTHFVGSLAIAGERSFERSSPDAQNACSCVINGVS